MWYPASSCSTHCLFPRGVLLPDVDNSCWVTSGVTLLGSWKEMIFDPWEWRRLASKGYKQNWISSPHRRTHYQQENFIWEGWVRGGSEGVWFEECPELLSVKLNAKVKRFTSVDRGQYGTSFIIKRNWNKLITIDLCILTLVVPQKLEKKAMERFQLAGRCW